MLKKVNFSEAADLLQFLFFYPPFYVSLRVQEMYDIVTRENGEDYLVK